MPPRSGTGPGSNAPKRLAAHHGSRAGPVKQGLTSLKYPSEYRRLHAQDRQRPRDLRDELSVRRDDQHGDGAQDGLKVGSTFRAYGKSLTVAAIFQSGSQQGNETVITSLPVLQRLERDTGLVFAAVVTASSLTDLSKVTSEIDRTLGKRASVVSYVSDAEQAVSDLNGVKASRSAVSSGRSGRQS